MQLFYSTDITDKDIILSNEDTNHCIKSLRKEIGDEVRVVYGKGNLSKCIIRYRFSKR